MQEEAEWTGFTGVSNCGLCKIIDKPTKEYHYQNGEFFLCDDCVKVAEE